MALSFIRYPVQTISAVINDPQQRVCVSVSVMRACVLSIVSCMLLTAAFIHHSCAFIKTTCFAISAALANVLLVDALRETETFLT